MTCARGGNAGLTIEDFDAALTLLGQRLLAGGGGETVEIRACGGYAMLYHGLRQEGVTVDIDTVTPDYPPAVSAAIGEVGRELGIGGGWLNNDCILSWDGGVTWDDVEAHDCLTDASYVAASRPGVPRNIVISVADVPTLARTKAYACDAIGMGRDMKDAHDLAAALGALGIESRAMLGQKAPWLDPVEMPTAHAIAQQALEAYAAAARGRTAPEETAALAAAVARGLRVRDREPGGRRMGI